MRYIAKLIGGHNNNKMLEMESHVDDLAREISVLIENPAEPFSDQVGIATEKSSVQVETYHLCCVASPDLGIYVSEMAFVEGLGK